MMLDHKGLAYENIMYEMDQWPAIKPTMPNGTVPILELDDGTKLCQQSAIIRYIGAVHGYYPMDPDQAIQVDILMEYANEFMGKAFPIAMIPDATAQAAAVADLFANVLPAFMGIVESKLKDGEWLVNNKLSTADFWCGQAYTNLMNNEVCYAQDKWAEAKIKYPKFAAFGEKFATENKAHLDARMKSPF